MLARKPSAGWHKEDVIEPLILEKKDYSNEPEKWNTILELCGFRPDYDIGRIKLDISTIEYFVERTSIYDPSRN